MLPRAVTDWCQREGGCQRGSHGGTRHLHETQKSRRQAGPVAERRKRHRRAERVSEAHVEQEDRHGRRVRGKPADVSRIEARQQGTSVEGDHKARYRDTAATLPHLPELRGHCAGVGPTRQRTSPRK